MNELILAETGPNAVDFCRVNGTGCQGAFLSKEVWQERAQKHHYRVAQWVDPFLERRSRHARHPVYDFLFEYYSFRPAQLLRWSPGPGVILEGAEMTDRAGAVINPGGGIELLFRPFGAGLFRRAVA